MLYISYDAAIVFLLSSHRDSATLAALPPEQARDIAPDMDDRYQKIAHQISGHVGHHQHAYRRGMVLMGATAQGTPFSYPPYPPRGFPRCLGAAVAVRGAAGRFAPEWGVRLTCYWAFL